MAEPHTTTSLGRLQPVSTPAQRGLRRLSLDLHDGPMQDLAAVGFALERLRRDVSQLPEGSHELSLQVDGIRDQLSTIESTLRELAGDQTDRVWETTLAQLVTGPTRRGCRCRPR